MVLKEIEKLLKLCRKQGVLELTTPEISFKLGELPTKQQDNFDETEQDVLENFPDGELTPEELTFFANGGNPQDNPYRNVGEN